MRKIALAAMVVTLVVAGCGDGGGDGGGDETADPDPVAGTFVGTVEGSDAYVAVVAGADSDVLAYVTDGGSSVDWLEGILEGPRDTAARIGNDGGAVLDVSFTGTNASGAFARPGEDPQTFTAEAVDEPAGLYRATESFADGDYVAGWIVLPDGTQRGAVRRYETPLTPGEVDATAFTVDTKTFTVPGGVLTPSRVTPDLDF